MKSSNLSDITPPKTRLSQLLLVASICLLVVTVFTITYAIFKNGSNQQSQVNSEKIAVVRITDKGFEPATLTVSKDTKIVWTNTGKKPHQIASNPYPQNTDLPDLKSEILNSDQTYSYQATTGGSFDYHDQQSPTTNGTLIIKE